jgi:cytochrome c-type biogenesis protein CcmF
LWAPRCLGLSAFQLIFTTSIPVYNKIAEAFGLVSNIALPWYRVEHYSKIGIWIFLAVAILSGVGQFAWWGKLKESTQFKPLYSSLLASVLATVFIVNVGKVYTVSHIALLWSGLFSLISDGKILWFLARQSTTPSPEVPYPMSD